MLSAVGTIEISSLTLTYSGFTAYYREVEWDGDEVFQEGGRIVPVMLSVTVVDRSGRNLSGQLVDAWYTSIDVDRLTFRAERTALNSASLRNRP